MRMRKKFVGFIRGAWIAAIEIGLKELVDCMETTEAKIYLCQYYLSKTVFPFLCTVGKHV